jgi:hypothetical protein
VGAVDGNGLFAMFCWSLIGLALITHELWAQAMVPATDARIGVQFVAKRELE